MPTTALAVPEPGRDPLLTIDAAANYLSVSRSFVQKCIYDTRVLPAVRIGKNIVRVRLSDVDALLDPVTK